MTLKLKTSLIKRTLLFILLVGLLLPLGIFVQSSQALDSKPTPTPDNTALINDLKEKLSNAEFEYQKAWNYQQLIANTANQYTDPNTIFLAMNNTLYWNNKVYEYKSKLIDLGYYVTSAPVANLNNNYNTIPQNNSPKSTLHLEKITCSFCHGTGKSPLKEYPPNYGLGITNGDTKCEICGSYEVHYHKTCPSCRGLGYTEKYMP